jgi:hypothetical protein
MTNNVMPLPTFGRKQVFNGLAMGGPLDGVVISHHAPVFEVAKVGATQVFRPLTQEQAEQLALEKVSYQFVLLLASSNPPFGLFIASTLQDDEHQGEPMVVTGVRELVKRYSDTTQGKAIPAAQHPSRRH